MTSSPSSPPEAATAVGRQAPEPSGIPTDQAMGRAIVKGWAVGVPGLFIIITIIALLAGASLLQAAEIAVMPSIVCGGFLSAAVFIGLASAKAEH